MPTTPRIALAGLCCAAALLAAVVASGSPSAGEFRAACISAPSESELPPFAAPPVIEDDVIRPLAFPTREYEPPDVIAWQDVDGEQHVVIQSDVMKSMLERNLRLQRLADCTATS